MWKALGSLEDKMLQEVGKTTGIVIFKSRTDPYNCLQTDYGIVVIVVIDILESVVEATIPDLKSYCVIHRLVRLIKTARDHSIGIVIVYGFVIVGFNMKFQYSLI